MTSQKEALSIPVRFIVLLFAVPLVFLLLCVFSGIAWGVLFIALVHLLITVMPMNSRLASLVLGQEHFPRLEKMLQRAARSVVYRLFFAFLNLGYFALAGILFRSNIRIWDLFK